MHDGGTSEFTDTSLQIKAASSATLVIAAATSFVNYHDISGDPQSACAKILAACADKDFVALRNRHVADFRGLMGRVHLQASATLP